MTRFRAVVLAVALLAAACASDADPLAPLPDVEGEQTATTETTVTTSSSTTEAPADDTDEDTAVESVDAEAAVLETWTTVMGAAASGIPDAEQLATIAELSSDNTTTQLEDFFPEDPTRELTHYPKLTEQDDGSYAIDDCVIMNRPFSIDLSTWFIGQADPKPDSPTGYEITNVQLINLDPCVPTSIAEAAIEGYENHQDAREIFFDPPNPDAPELEATTTGAFLEFTTNLIEQFERDGQRLTGRAKTDPQFLKVNSPTEVVVIDCQIADPERGVYNIETAERTDLIPPIDQGQVDLVETTLTLEDGAWKVSDVQGDRNLDGCKSLPFNEALLQITGG